MDFRHFWRFLKIRFQSGAQVDVVAIVTAAKLEGHGEAVYRIPVVPGGTWTLDSGSLVCECKRRKWQKNDILAVLHSDRMRFG